MSGTATIHADGSSPADSRTVEIDREAERYRWACPNGHTSWDRTNSHVWCGECARQAENGVDVDPEHWEIVDKMTGETIPYAAVIWE